MMTLPALASGPANSAKAPSVAASDAPDADNGATFAKVHQQSRAQPTDPSAPQRLAQTSDRTHRPTTQDDNTQADNEQTDNEPDLANAVNRASDGQLEEPDTASILGDADLAAPSFDKPLSAQQTPLVTTPGEQTALPADVSSEADSVRAESLAEPSTRLWHWRYSRQTLADATTRQGEPAALLGLEPASLAGATLARAHPASEGENKVMQVQAERMASENRVAESSLPIRGDKGMAESFFATQVTSNKLLLQQLGPSVATAGINHQEEASPPAASLTSLVAGASGRAGMPIHEWASITVEVSNKATLGMQLVQALKEKVELQLNQDVQQARIKLDPPEMGRLELSIRLEGDKLHIHINASHSGVRDALNAQADRLRQDLLPQHSGGVEVSVGHEGERQQSASQRGDANIQLAEHAQVEPAGEQSPPVGSSWVNALV